MLSQRTVGRFQRVLDSLFYSRLIYGSPTALSDGEYHNRLYQEGIRPELLDHIGNQYGYDPQPSVRALHEGHAINWVYRSIDRNHSIPMEVAREIGDTYLLVFAAVALRRYEELSYDRQSLYRNEVQGFLQSLKEDGFSYYSGHIWDSQGRKVAPTPFTQVSKITPDSTHLAQAQAPKGVAVSERQVHEPSASVLAKSPTAGGKGWSVEAKLALLSMVVLVVVGLATPEIRRWLGLERPEVVHAPNAVSSSAPGTRGQEDVNNEPAKPPTESMQKNEAGKKKKAQDSSRPAPTEQPGVSQKKADEAARRQTTPSTTTEKHKTSDSVSAVVNPAPDTVAVSVNRAGLKTRVDSKDKMNWRKHLREGMTANEVRSLFGEPDRIYDSGAWQIWEYGGGSITLADGRIHGWSEPH